MTERVPANTPPMPRSFVGGTCLFYISPFEVNGFYVVSLSQSLPHDHTRILAHHHDRATRQPRTGLP